MTLKKESQHFKIYNLFIIIKETNYALNDLMENKICL